METGIHQPTESLRDQTGIPVRQSNRNTFNAKTNGKSRKRKFVCGVWTTSRRKRGKYAQRKSKKRTRAGQRKVHSRQETAVYFPKSVNESTNRGNGNSGEQRYLQIRTRPSCEPVAKRPPAGLRSIDLTRTEGLSVQGAQIDLGDNGPQLL